MRREDLARLASLLHDLRVWALAHFGDLKTSNPYGWSSEERRKAWNEFYERSDTVLNVADQLEKESSDSAGLLVEIEDDLRSIQELLTVLLAAHKDHPELREMVAEFNTIFPPKEVINRLEEDERLASHPNAYRGAPNPFQLYRRKAFRWLAAGGIAAFVTLTPMKLRALWQHQAQGIMQPAPQAPQLLPGIYLQFGGYPTEEEAIRKRAEIGLPDLVIFKSSKMDGFPFKIFLSTRFFSADGARAHIKILQRLAALESVGIVQLNPDSTTTWVKTIEQEIVERGRAIASSLLAQQEKAHASYHQFIVDAVRRYDLARLMKVRTEKEAIAIVHGFIDVESSGNPDARGPTGDFGLMQVVDTDKWSTWNVVHLGQHQDAKSTLFHHGAQQPHICDIFDPQQNIDCGVAYLAYLFRSHPGKPMEVVLRMYNAAERDVLSGKAQNYKYADKIVLASNQYR